MKCTHILGHKWEPWEQHEAMPKKSEDGNLYTQVLQSRKCKRCGFEQADWLPKARVTTLEAK